MTRARIESCAPRRLRNPQMRRTRTSRKRSAASSPPGSSPSRSTRFRSKRTRSSLESLPSADAKTASAPEVPVAASPAKTRRRPAKSVAENQGVVKKVWIPRSMPAAGRAEACAPATFEARRATVLRRLSRYHVPEELPGLESQRHALASLLRKTLTQGENNAALLVGPHGCGKSATLRRVLRDLKGELVKQGKSFIEVYLSGHVLASDTQAMESIVKQLCKENNVELDGKKSKSFSDNLEFLRSVLESGKLKDTPVFFVLDDFDLFASRSRRQTLLYNLCDLLQEYHAQLALVGLTTRFDSYELLEKRIRSRITYRIIVFRHVTADEAQRAFSAALRLPEAEAHNAAVDQALADVRVRKLLDTPDVPSGGRLAFLHGLGSYAFATCLDADTHPFLSADDILKAATELHPFSPSARLDDCTVIQLTMLLSLCILEGMDAVSNFMTAYATYEKRCRAASSRELEHRFSRVMCLDALAELESAGLVAVRARESSLNDLSTRFQDISLTLLPSQVLQHIKNKATCPSWLRQWARDDAVARAQRDHGEASEEVTTGRASRRGQTC